MRGLRTAAIIVAVAAANLATPSAAQEVPPELNERQHEILRIVRNADGYIDEALHAEFWTPIPEEMRDQLGALMEEVLSGGIADIRKDFLEQSWVAARASLDAGRVVRPASYIEARDALLNAWDNSGYIRSSRESVEQGERLLEAAANGTPLDTADGKVYITLDMIEQVMDSLDASEERFRKLASPTWDDELREYRYPEARVAILSTAPFTQSKDSITLVNGVEMPSVNLSQTQSEDAYLEVMYAPFSFQVSDPVKVVRGAIEGGMEAIGTSANSPAIENWRGMTSSYGSAHAITSDGSFHVTMRAVFLPDKNALLQFIAVSTLSGADALLRIGELESSTMILP